MHVAMIGAGYVGLVSGACFADFGHEVCCVDKDAGRIAALRAGRMPLFEPGLSDLVAANVRAGRLSFAGELAEAVARADAVFIGVGTPRGAATAMPTSPSSTRRPARSRRRCPATPWW